MDVIEVIAKLLAAAGNVVPDCVAEGADTPTEFTALTRYETVVPSERLISTKTVEYAGSPLAAVVQLVPSRLRSTVSLVAVASWRSR